MAQLLSGTRIYGTGTIDTQLFINGGINSSTTGTGALVVLGGIGVSQDLRVGGTIYGNISGTITGTASTATSLGGGTPMSIVYQSAADTTAFLAAGTSGQILRTNGTASAPSWVSLSGLTVGIASQVSTQAQTASAAYYPTFVDTNNATATAETVYTTSSFAINPATGNVGVGTTSPTNKLVVSNAGAAGLEIAPTGGLSSGPAFISYNRSGAAYTPITSYALNHAWYVGSAGNTRAVDIDSSGNVFINSTAQLNTGFTNKLNVQGAVVAGDGSSTNGSTILQGYYGTGALTVIGTNRSSGGPMIGYGVTPSITTSNNFLSSTGVALARSAIIADDSVRIYTAASVTAAIGGVVTLTERMRLTNLGGLSFGSSGSAVGTSGQILQSNGDAAPTWVNPGSITSGVASQVNTVRQVTNATYYPTFVDANNATATAESVYTTSSFSINAATGAIGVTGALTVGGAASIAGAASVAGTLSLTNSATTALIVKSNIDMVSPDSASTITIRMLNSDAISVSGNSGQLFSITDSMTGTIFAVNDISGVPSIEVYDTGEVRLAETFGYVNIPNATNSTGVTSGALVTTGGVGIAKDLYVGGTIYGSVSVSGIISTATNIAGGTAGQVPYQTAPGITGFFGPGTSGNVLVSNGTSAPTYNNTLALSGTTAASSAITGALTVAGGVGINNNLYVTNNINIVNGQIVSTRANSTATSAGQIFLNGATGNRIDWNTNGVAAPAFTDRSAGTKLVLWPAVNSTQADYGFGIDTSTLWASVPTTSQQFRWYGGTTLAATLSGAGALTLVGDLAVNGGDITTSASSFNLVNSGATTVNFAGAGTTVSIGAASGTTTINNNLTVTGNMTVSGTTTYVNSTVTNIVDPIIVIGGGTNGAAPTVDDNKDRGLAYQWHNGTTAKYGFIGYDDSSGFLTFIPDATITNEVISGTKGAINAHLAGGAEMSLVYQSAADTTAFLAASTAGYVLQTNGTGSAPSWVSPTGLSAAAAAQIATITRTTAATHYLTFVDSDNATLTNENLYTNAGISVNPNTDTLRIESAIGAADAVTYGLASYDTTAMAANVGGQLVLGYKYTTAGAFTEGAIIKSYKLNATDADYSSGLKFQVRNNGAALSTKMTLDPSGNLTISGDMTVSGNNVVTAAVDARVKYSCWSDLTYGMGFGSGYTFGPLESDYAVTFQNSNTDSRGFWWGDASHTNAQGAMALSTNGKLTVAHSIRVGFGETDTTLGGSVYALEVNGAFAATTKSFLIDHPTKSGMKLRHGSLEGPENGVYVRGKLKGTTVIDLPEYWTKLVDPDTITVQLTSIGKHQDLYVKNISNNKIYIGSDSVDDINCFYIVNGERIDVEKLEVETR